MKKVECDIVVIGSGIGGTTAAALLAKEGFKTIIVEKLPFAGGRCATLDYNGYKINTGICWVHESTAGALCKEVGSELELRYVDPPIGFRVDGKDYFEPMGLMAMITQVARDEDEAERVLQALMSALSWQEPSDFTSIGDWVKQYSDNPKMLGLFQFFAREPGLNMDEMPAGELFRWVSQAPQELLGALPGGGGQLTDTLIQTIKKRGGEVWTRCPAIKINVEDNAATGVVVRKDGEDIEIAAQAVISNALPRLTVKLVGEENLNPGYLKDVENVPSTAQIIYHLVSNKPLIDCSCPLAFTESRRVYGLMQLTNSCPEMAPKGKHLLMAGSTLTSGRPPYDFKKEVALALQDLKENLADFEVLRINCCHGDWPVIGAWPGRKMPIRTAVIGLYLANDSSGPLGYIGGIAAMTSGRLVAEDVTIRFSPA
ncbi:MAG: FAD-binding protein [Pseudomonadota bacterium]